MPKLILEFADPAVFHRAVARYESIDRLERILARIVSDETVHDRDGLTIRFDTDRQVDIVLYVAGDTLPSLEGLAKVFVRSASQVLGTLRSFDLGDMPARKDRIGWRVKQLLAIPGSENIQMDLDLLPKGHWSKI